MYLLTLPDLRIFKLRNFKLKRLKKKQKSKHDVLKISAPFSVMGMKAQ